jgi:hypothetical protein
MKTKALSLTVFLITLITITSSVAEAQARRKVTLQASVPYEFVIGNRTLPAGTYVFEMATGVPKSTDQAGVLIVHNYERKLYVAVATGVENDNTAHALPKLMFVRSGDRLYLSKVWRQGEIAGLSVHTPANEPDAFEESEVLTLDAMTSGGI